MSGSGKSWLLGLLAEQLCERTPIVVIDREGEFASLRKRHDLLLVGEDGELPCNPVNAKTLARRIVELGISAVISLDQLHYRDRPLYVKHLLNGFIDLPKRLWPSSSDKHLVVFVDEAHQFCPEGKTLASSDAVINLMDAGRKRGICGILATQRLSKLSKHAAAECANIFIGRTSPIDQARAVDLLGLPPKERHALSQLPDGHWKASGQALPPGVHTFHAQAPKTFSAKSRSKALTPPKPSKLIQGVLPELAGLTEMAEQEIRDLQAAQALIMRLEQALKIANKKQPELLRTGRAVSKSTSISMQAVAQMDATKDKAHKLELQTLVKKAKERDGYWARALKAANDKIAKANELLRVLKEKATLTIDPQVGPDNVSAVVMPDSRGFGLGQARYDIVGKASADASSAVREAAAVQLTSDLNAAVDNGLTSSHTKILKALAWWAAMGVEKPDKANIAIMAGYSGKGGRYQRLLGELRTEGYVDYAPGNAAYLTSAGVAYGPATTAPGTMRDLHNAWRQSLTPSHVKILDAVIHRHPHGASTSELALAAEYSEAGGRFQRLVGELKTRGLITRNDGHVAATKLLFPEGLD